VSGRRLEIAAEAMVVDSARKEFDAGFRAGHRWKGDFCAQADVQ
jgi:hypothetical protein